MRNELIKPSSDLITNPPKSVLTNVLITVNSSRIIKALMNAARTARKDRTILGGIVTDSDDVIELLTGELINRLRAVT